VKARFLLATQSSRPYQKTSSSRLVEPVQETL